MKFHLPVLPYKTSGLEPFMSQEQLEMHYFGHHQGYIDKVNEASEKLGIPDISLEKLILNYDGDIFNNAAQAWNHTFFWLGLRNPTRGPTPDSKFLTAVKRQFGDLDSLKAKFVESATHLFGSGWTWLTAGDGGELLVVNTQNGDNPISREHSHPLWCCDVWEHAYYIDYRKERKAFVEAAWEHANWVFIEKNYELKQIPVMTKLMRGIPEGRQPTASFM
jgi:Fe-Mn family superoxide dismutase